MDFARKLKLLFLNMSGLTGDEYPGIARDILLGIPMAFAVLILLVYPSIDHPSERLKYSAIASLIVLIAGLILAKSKADVISGIAGFVVLRSIVAIVQGLVWQGLLVAGVSIAIIVGVRRWRLS